MPSLSKQFACRSAEAEQCALQPNLPTRITLRKEAGFFKEENGETVYYSRKGTRIVIAETLEEEKVESAQVSAPKPITDEEKCRYAWCCERLKKLLEKKVCGLSVSIYELNL